MSVLGIPGNNASLWYLIADANGMSETESLTVGTVLTIPNVVTNIHNNSDTFWPYDPGRAMAEVADSGGCGAATIIIAIVVIVVVCIFAPYMAGVVANMGTAMVSGGGLSLAGAMVTCQWLILAFAKQPSKIAR